MKVLIVGYGKMGQLIDAMAAEQGIEVAGRVDDGRDEWRAGRRGDRLHHRRRAPGQLSRATSSSSCRW